MNIKEGWQHENDWFVSEKDDDRYLLIANADLDVSVYIEEWKRERELSSHTAEYSVYGVGIHDRTIAAHPSIPGSVYEEGTWTKALCRAFQLVQNVGEHIENMRNSDDYGRAIVVKEESPPTREEGGIIPGFEVRNREGDVYSGRKTVDEALAELEGPVTEKHTDEQ